MELAHRPHRLRHPSINKPTGWNRREYWIKSRGPRASSLFARLPSPGTGFFSSEFRQSVIRARGVSNAKTIQNFQRCWNISPGGALAEILLGSQRGKFLSDGDIDELIKRCILRRGNGPQFLQERWLKAKGKITLSHGSNLQNGQGLRGAHRAYAERKRISPAILQQETAPILPFFSGRQKILYPGD